MKIAFVLQIESYNCIAVPANVILRNVCNSPFVGVKSSEI